MCWISASLALPVTAWAMRRGVAAGGGGAAREGFVSSTTDATPGYLAGPIDPGVWAVALGPVVLNPWGMAWQAQVTMERGTATAPAGQVIEMPSSPVVRGAGWYRGDLHLHTVHSDGAHRPSELVSAAHAGGLDFIVSTDHNTSAANRVWPACRTDALLVIPGEEVTTRHGHWLAVGLPAHGWVGWRYRSRDGALPRLAGGGGAGAGPPRAAQRTVGSPGDTGRPTAPSRASPAKSARVVAWWSRLIPPCR